MRLVLPLVVAVLIACIGGCRTVPIQDVRNTPLGTAPSTNLNIQEVSKAIWAAGAKLGWVIKEVRPGELTGTLSLRRHVAVVTITHDTSTFNITYKDSQNLLQQGQEIHRNYNRWVQNLVKEIQTQTALVSARR